MHIFGTEQATTAQKKKKKKKKKKKRGKFVSQFSFFFFLNRLSVKCRFVA